MSDDRDNDEDKRWSRAVKTAGNFQCALCSAKDVYLESHHKNAYNSYPEQRTLLSNGICLCSYHHNQFHHIWGKGNNTEGQFRQYEEIYKTFRKIAEKQLEESKEK